MGMFGEKVGLYFLNGVGEGEKNNLSCSVVLGLFRVVRLLFDFVLWLFRDGFVFFRPCACIWAGPSSILILLRLWLDEKMPTFSFSSPAKVEIRANSKQNLLVKLIFLVKTEISGEKISQGEGEKRSKKVDFAPKVAESGEKGRFGGGNHREGMKRKIELYYRFCNSMK